MMVKSINSAKLKEASKRWYNFQVTTLKCAIISELSLKSLKNLIMER